MNHPLPVAIASLLERPPTNLSLWFNRGYSGYESDFTERTKDGRSAFFATICQKFERARESRAAEYADRQMRRRRTLARMGVCTVRAVSTQPLVLGLGLPHATEAGFLLDSLTGVPYIPGSSVKGLLRAAARLVIAEELAVEAHPKSRAYWSDNLHRVFGPEIDGSLTPAQGAATVFDAFPEGWPSLTVDILTPHYGPYYGDPAVPPGDWHSPVPVPFLAIAPGTPFFFSFGQSSQRNLNHRDCLAIATLLGTALDWLGIGGKTRSQGYGTFELGEKGEQEPLFDDLAGGG